MSSPEGVKTPFRCPCCRYRTLAERDVYDICPVCFWEDDGQDDNEEGIHVECIGPYVLSGPNGNLTLASARATFLRIGAIEERLVPVTRKPKPEEIDESTQP